MLTVQVTYKGNDNNWNTIAHYQTRRGVDNFLAKNSIYYPENLFTIRVIGEEQVKPKAPNYRELVKIGDVFVGSYGYDATFYEAYVVVGFTPSGKSLKVKKLFKTDASNEIHGYGPAAWGIRFSKPSDEYMKDNENVQTMRILSYNESIYFNISRTRMAFLAKDFNYSHVYVEDDYH